MANDAVGIGAPLLTPWRIAGWSISVILLIVPAIAMRFTSEVDWSTSDFIVMGALFGAIGLGIEFFMRQPRNMPYRAAAVLALVAAFLTIWVNLAVGMIGDDNPYNLLFGGVLLIALIGAILVKFRPAGMAQTMAATAIAQGLAGAGGLPIDPGGAIFSMIFAVPWLLAAVLFRNAAREG